MSHSFFCSDPHFRHENISNFRKRFSSSTENDKVILDNILETVGRRDKLFILGDVLFKKDGMHIIEKIVDHVPNLTIVLGNHDLENKGCPTIHDYLDLGIEIKSMVKYKKYWLTHCPVHETELRGRFNIHGHGHYAIVPDLRYINVCFENIGYRPIDLDTINSICLSRKDFIRMKLDQIIESDMSDKEKRSITNSDWSSYYKEYYNEYRAKFSEKDGDQLTI